MKMSREKWARSANVDARRSSCFEEGVNTVESDTRLRGLQCFSFLNEWTEAI